MIINNREFAEKIYDFLQRNDEPGRFEGASFDESVAEIESYLSDHAMVTETIKDIEEIADEFDDHEVYVSEVKPILRGLQEIQVKLEAEQRRRMVGDTKYEVINAMHIGDKEIVFAEDKNAENGMCFFIGNYSRNDVIGQYTDCQICDDYLEAVQEFTGRVNTQIKLMKSEISQSKTCEIFTAEHCHRNDYSQSIDGKIVAIKAEILRPEYRRGDVQLVLVSGGSGAKENPYGRAVYCYHLNNGQHTRFERHNVQGEVKAECLPAWAAEKAAAIQAETAVQQHNNPKERNDAR